MHIKGTGMLEKVNVEQPLEFITEMYIRGVFMKMVKNVAYCVQVWPCS